MGVWTNFREDYLNQRRDWQIRVLGGKERVLGMGRDMSSLVAWIPSWDIHRAANRAWSARANSAPYRNTKIYLLIEKINLEVRIN